MFAVTGLIPIRISKSHSCLVLQCMGGEGPSFIYSSCYGNIHLLSHLFVLQEEDRTWLGEDEKQHSEKDVSALQFST